MKLKAGGLSPHQPLTKKNYFFVSSILGRTYEYCIAQFAAYEGVKGGEFYTPSSIVKTIVEVLKPFDNCRVYDPCCGSGGMFVQSAKFIQAHRTLCKTIAKRMHDLTESAVDANNAATQSAIDTYKANSEAIRQFMNNPEGSEFTIAECFAELR